MSRRETSVTLPGTLRGRQPAASVAPGQPSSRCAGPAFRVAGRVAGSGLVNLGGSPPKRKQSVKRNAALDRMLTRPTKGNAGPSWKPGHCATCGSKWPGRNIDGGKTGSPWYCSTCVKAAKPLPCDDLNVPPAGQAARETGAQLLL